MLENKKLGFIGCGNMASALIKGLLSQGIPANNIIASAKTTSKLTSIQNEKGILVTTKNQEVCEFSEIIVLCAKPYVIPEICTELCQQDLSRKLIVSVAAGVTISRINSLLGRDLAVVRAMPNTPATISEAATGLYANSATSEPQKNQSSLLFRSIGHIEWVAEESLINVVTAIAGSAPAYIFLFIQSMVDQAVESGLDPIVAKNLAVQAVLGASKLAKMENSKSLSKLQEEVTSPGGTTEAAIKSFQQNNFTDIIKCAVSKAANRAKELGEQV